MTKTTRFSFMRRFWYNKPVRWSLLGILLPVSGVMTAYAVTEPVSNPQGIALERISEELPAVYVETNNFQSSYWAQEVVQQGDSLADVLARMGVAQTDIKQIMAKNSADQNMQHLRANQSVNIRVDSSGQVTDVQFFTDEELERNLVALEKVKGKWQLSTSEVDMKVMPTLRSIVVRTSARGAMAQAEIPVEIRESLSEIFSDVLSLEDLQEGDVVRLLYNNMYFRGQQMGTGDILAAEIVKGGKTYQAYYYSQRQRPTKRAAAIMTKTVNRSSKKRDSISSRLSIPVFHRRLATGFTPSCIPSVCIPVLTMPHHQARRLKHLPTV